MSKQTTMSCTAATSTLGANRTHCHLRYSFTTECSEACEGEEPFPKTQHPYQDTLALRGENMISENPAPSGYRARTADTVL